MVDVVKSQRIAHIQTYLRTQSLVPEVRVRNRTEQPDSVVPNKSAGPPDTERSNTSFYKFDPVLNRVIIGIRSEKGDSIVSQTPSQMYVKMMHDDSLRCAVGTYIDEYS